MIPPDPETRRKIAMLGGACVLALGVAAWSIRSALEPPVAPDRSARNTAATSAAAPDAGSAAGALQPLQAHPQAEATLALNVDPFTPLPAHAEPRTSPSVRPLPRSGVTLNLPPIHSATGDPGYLPLPGAQPDLQPRPAAPQPEKPEEPPQLVGTMLGDTPSAVFRINGGSRVVPVGESIRGWTVEDVSHGRATLSGKSGTRQLRVGGASGKGRIRMEEPASRGADSGQVQV